ncbi:NHL domain-containing protein [Euphorbia peplus]|nr:NHL domain-containing protein [Euphorbia peplus]
MYLKFRLRRQISQLIPTLFNRNHLQQTILCSAYSSISAPISGNYCIPNANRGFHSQSYFQVSNNIPQLSISSIPPTVNEILSFVKSTFKDPQGQNHCWLNVAEGDKEFFKKDGAFFVVTGNLCQGYEIVSVLEKVKILQQRFPQLCIIGFHCGTSINSVADQTKVVQLIMKEYITFPILLSKKSFLEMENGPCCILCKDFRNPVYYHMKELDLGMLSKAIEEIQVQQNRKLDNGKSSKKKLKSTWMKQDEVFKEPELSSPLQNLLLYYPGCVSADEIGDRLFLSDINHHRIIISDGNGKIMDSIGAGPGFEDGEFESAKLLRPAASIYDDAEDCLYIVDSENKAIRRADLGRRVLETLYPTCSIRKNESMWTWILEKMGFARNDTKSKEVESQMLAFPWHIMKSEDDDLLILNRSFETLWIMDVVSGKIKEVIEEFPKIMETCGHLITEKVSLLKQMPKDWLQLDSNYSPKGLPFDSHISSVTTFQDHIVMCDTIEQRVLIANRESGVCSNFQLSNFGILGLPYWASFPVEKVYSETPSGRGQIDHLQSFSLLPGQVGIKLNLDIPVDVQLVEPLEEGCIWRQARGAATVVLEEGAVGSSEKVGVAQDWYDDLDNLAFTTPEPELTVEDSSATSIVNSEDNRPSIDCTVNISPGTSEVIIYAALYLKLTRQPDVEEESQEKYAARIFNILNMEKRGLGRDSCIQLLLRSRTDLRDLIFVKPLHVRIRIKGLNHPKADNARDIIETESYIDVNVSLET